ncbi:MAG: hypothetical protein D6714_21515 [Bacteroidetes bacterium]|nr:MAG: hypothetical protein D6714_21515 [Bacteroidota bacterium]
MGFGSCFSFERDPRRQKREIQNLRQSPKANRTIHFTPKNKLNTFFSPPFQRWAHAVKKKTEIPLNQADFVGARWFA